MQSLTKQAGGVILGGGGCTKLFRMCWMTPNNKHRWNSRRGAKVEGYTIVGYTCDPGYTTGDVFSIGAVLDGKRQTYAIGMRGDV